MTFLEECKRKYTNSYTKTDLEIAKNEINLAISHGKTVHYIYCINDNEKEIIVNWLINEGFKATIFGDYIEVYGWA
jgi:hypothetical protein